MSTSDRTPYRGLTEGDTDENLVETAMNAGILIASPQDPETNTYTTLPRGATLVDLERLRSTPRRITADVSVVSVESFLQYHGKFRSFATIIMTNAQAALARARAQDQQLPDVHFTAHLNYHMADKPSWDSHRLTLKLLRTREWSAWTGINRRKMNQEQFTTFVRENMPDIVEPDAATLMEILERFEVREEVNFISATDVAGNNVQFMFEKTSSAAKGGVTMPKAITLAVRVFEGMDAYRVPVDLRWRLHERKLELWIDMVRFHRFERDAVATVEAQIREASGETIIQTVD